MINRNKSTKLNMNDSKGLSLLSQWNFNKGKLRDELRRTKEWMSIHEYEWRMNEEELKYELVYMNMYGGWIKKN